MSTLSLFRRIGVRNLLARPLSSLITVLGIALGVALFSSITKINRATRDYFRESIESISGKASLVISSDDTGFSEDVIPKIEKMEGIASVAPVIETRAWSKQFPETLTVMGVDLLQEQPVRSYRLSSGKILGDSLSFISEPDSVLLTESFATAHGIALGKAISLETSRGPVRLTVRGLLAPNGLGTAFGGAVAIMDIDAARLAFSKRGKVDRLDLTVSEGVSSEALRDKIAGILDSNLSIERPESRSGQIETMMKLFQVTLDFMGSLALLVGVFLVFNTCSVSVAQRRKEIGLLRALGAEQGQIERLILLEALLIGAVGGLLGSIAGHLGGMLMLNTVSQNITSQFMGGVSIKTVRLKEVDFLIGISIAVGAALIGSILPARRAARVEPLEAIRSGAGTSSSSRSFVARRGHWIGLPALALALALAYLPHPSEMIWYEALVTILALLGATLTAPSLLLFGVTRLGRAKGLQTNAAAFLGTRNTVKNEKRTSGNAMGMILALLLVLVIASIQRSFSFSFSEWANQTFYWELIAGSNPRNSSYLNQAIDGKLANEIKSIAGVTQVIGVRYVRIRHENGFIGLKAYDPTIHSTQEALSLYDVMERRPGEVADELKDASKPSILISENFARRFNKKAGESVTLSTHHGPKNFRVAAIVRDLSSTAMVVMDRNQYQAAFEDPLINKMNIKLAPHANAMEVRRAIHAKLGERQHLSLMMSSEVRAQMLDAIDKSFAFMRTIEIAALFVAILGLFNNFLVGVFERTREFGFLRAIGMSRPQLIRLLLVESTVQGALVSLLAVGFGISISAVVVTHILPSGFGWRVAYSFPWVDILLTVGLGVVSAALAGLYPSLKAGKIEVLEAIRHE